MRRKFTNPFGFVHSSDMIGRYTHTRKQANLFFPLFSFFFLFYTNSFLMKRRQKEIGLYNVLGLEKTHAAGRFCFVCQIHYEAFAAGNCKPETLSANSYRAA